MRHRYFINSIGIGSFVVLVSVASVYGAQVSEQVQQNIDTLMQTNGCPGCDLQQGPT